MHFDYGKDWQLNDIMSNYLKLVLDDYKKGSVDSIWIFFSVPDAYKI